jgi:hypothetical protein
MTLGEGIFYSSLFLGVIALYIATKDRWRWKRIILWPLGLIAVVAAGVGIFAYVESLPTAQTEFWGISLGEKKEDVRFKKGAPEQEEENNIWVYTQKSGSGSTDSTWKIRFENGEVVSVERWPPGTERWASPPLLGIRQGNSTAHVTQRLGEPSKITHDSDGMIRTYEYEKYHFFAIFVADEVEVYGIYGGEHGFVTIARSRSELVEREKLIAEVTALRAQKARALRQRQQQDVPPWEEARRVLQKD